MKKLYLATFIKGLERPVEAMLRHEGGVSVDRILPGLAVFRSVKEVDLPFLQRSFLLLCQMKPEKDVSSAVRKMSESDAWLDRFPFEETEGKRFRIVTAEDGQPCAANMRFISRIEKSICEQTGMIVNRERPEVELWINSRAEAVYFLWRLTKRDRKTDDPLRKDLCEILSFMTSPVGKNAALLGVTGRNLPEAFRSQGIKGLALAYSKPEYALKPPAGGGKNAGGTASHTDLADTSQEIVSLCIPPKGNQAVAQTEIRSTLREAARILAADGKLLLLYPQRLQNDFEKIRAMDYLTEYHITISGEPCRVVLLRKPENLVDAEDGN